MPSNQLGSALALLGGLAAVQQYGALGKELKYPEGVKPGDQISGAGGEYFRYKHVLIKPPDDDDRAEALRMSEDVRCQACEILLQSLLKKAESFSEDHIMDQLDGDLEPYKESTDPQEERVNKNRKACNKHFKDELLLKGWNVHKCRPEAEAQADSSGDKKKEFCLTQSGGRTSDRDVDTYSVRSEAVFLTCEHTIAKHGPEIATMVSERLEDGGSVEEAAKAACLQAARCDPIAAEAERRKRAEESKKRRRRQRRKSKSSEADADL
eukprot:TRINITY_DN23121_c0_g1_i1.p1 TRINITY_DN23121_c0_g1~~TRINITY_DN23121_c0_g1_i1.p1  ORF type:complete len:288 (-),score=72.25 TRINITY_DN23121_c0_g1_i1:185-985(-)